MQNLHEAYRREKEARQHVQQRYEAEKERWKQKILKAKKAYDDIKDAYKLLKRSRLCYACYGKREENVAVNTKENEVLGSPEEDLNTKEQFLARTKNETISNCYSEMETINAADNHIHSCDDYSNRCNAEDLELLADERTLGAAITVEDVAKTNKLGVKLMKEEEITLNSVNIDSNSIKLELEHKVKGQQSTLNPDGSILQSDGEVIRPSSGRKWKRVSRKGFSDDGFYDFSPPEDRSIESRKRKRIDTKAGEDRRGHHKSLQGFKHREVVRSKVEREQLHGVECQECRKFYDIVQRSGISAINFIAGGCNSHGPSTHIPNSSNMSLRCGLVQDISRHRYKYEPPPTPPGFWNIPLSPSPKRDELESNESL